MKITKEQLQQIIKEELEEEMGGGMPDKAEIEEVLDDVLQNIRKNALSDDIAKQGARAEVLLSMLMGGRYAAEMYKDMFGERVEMKKLQTMLYRIEDDFLPFLMNSEEKEIGEAANQLYKLLKARVEG